MKATQRSVKDFFVVGIGASAGGLDPFRELLGHLPVNTDMAFVFVQHLNPSYSSQLAEILSKSTSMPVMEVKNGTLVRPNHVFIIPPNKKIMISGGALALEQKTEQLGHPSIVDSFFSSLAKDQKDKAVGVILSGTGTDGAKGVEDIHAAGGITFAQNGSAKFEGMSQTAIATGCVDFILSPQKIAKQLVQISRHPNEDHSKAAQKTSQIPDDKNMEDLSKILKLIRNSTKIDFKDYKKATLNRRIARRMMLAKKETQAEYFTFLKSYPEEIKLLSEDLLIRVTSFFRHPPTFEVLQKDVFPIILKERTADAAIKFWIPGCSTGEEVYSIAIAFFEILGGKSHIRVQIFGTDVSEAAIEKARTGFYTLREVAGISPQRLKRFFTKEAKGYRINREIRDLCIFARQDLTKDPPFSTLDLVSCRNLLIYFEPALQQRVISLFHYGLKSSGFLVLGNSEALGSFGKLFVTVSKQHKIYSKKVTAGSTHFSSHDYATGKGVEEKQMAVTATDPRAFKADFQKEAVRAILARYAPAGVIINEEMEIVQILGHTGAYLEPPPGELSDNLLKMARPGLLPSLHAAIQKAIKEDVSVKKERVRIKYNQYFIYASFEVLPLKIAGSKERHFIILFAEESPAVKKSESTTRRVSDVSEAERLEQDLAAMREYLQSVIDKEQAVNEELKIAHDEVLSSNEEFQSTNEELETAKEELQSSNEELTTLNDELQSRNHLLAEANNDLENLLTSVELPVIMLDRDLRLRRFTPLAEKLFKLIPTDVGRSMHDIRHHFGNTFDDTIARVLQTHIPIEQEIQDGDGTWFSLWVRPYLTSDGSADGIVAVLIDVDSLKRARDFAGTIIQTIRESLIVLDENLRVTMVNQCFCQTFQVTTEETNNRLFYELGDGQWNSPALRDLLEDVLSKNKSFQDFEVFHRFPKIGEKTMLLNARQIYPNQRRPAQVLLVIEDVTKRKDAENKLLHTSSDLMNTNKDLEQFAYVASHDLQEPLRAMSTYLELLVKRHQDKLGKEANELITVAVNAAKRMKMLVGDLLHFSQAAKEELKYEPTDCGQLVDQIMVEFQPMVDSAQAEITHDPLPTVFTDPILLGQIFKNLINNAIKFRGIHAPKIHISAEKNANEWIFSVKDNGIGIETKYADRIFLIFQRLHSQEEYPGTGIGLAMCKRIINRYGGRIWFDSKIGVGSTFHFSVLHRSKSDTRGPYE